MLQTAEIRDLLLADVALRRGLVETPDVAAALHRYWHEREAGGPGIGAILRESAGVSEEVLAAIEKEVDTIVAAHGGDPRTVLTGRGALEPTVTAALGRDLKRRARLGNGNGNGVVLRRLPEDRYVEFIPVAEGGMGVVYMALDTELHRLVAFKLVRPDAGAKDPQPAADTPVHLEPPRPDTPAGATFDDLRRRLLQEAWVTGGLEHPGIVPVYELGETTTGIPYYTMRFVEGQQTLASAIAEVEGEGIEHRLSLLEHFLKLCDAVSYAHAKGVIHRDLKPDNVALGDFGEVILLDWGLAKLERDRETVEDPWKSRIREYRETEDLKTIASMLGTPGYMAPEAACGRVEDVDRRSDVYSLGVILYEILTGQVPYAPDHFSEWVARITTEDAPRATDVQADVPSGLATLCARALDRDREARLPDADALAAGIRSWQAASALDREVADRCTEAAEALARAESVRGTERLDRVDEAAAALLTAQAKRPDDDRATDLRRRAEALRATALAEREDESVRRARRRGLAWTAVVLLVVAAVTYAGIQIPGWMKERAHRRARAEVENRGRREFAEVRGLPPASAIPRLQALIDRDATLRVIPEARLRLAESFREELRRERAQSTIYEAWLHHPTDETVQQATLDLGRQYVMEGRLAEASSLAAELRLQARSPSLRVRAALLAAETAWGRASSSEMQDYLADARAVPLPGSTAEGQRLEMFAALAEQYRVLWAHADPIAGQVTFGCFRRGQTHLVVSEDDVTRVHRVGIQGIEVEPILAWPTPGGVRTQVEPLDLNGDGLDELVCVTDRGKDIHEKGLNQQWLIIYDLRGPVPVEVTRVPVEGAGYAFGAGDLDGDGDQDLVLGQTYYHRGVVVLRQEADRLFTPLTEVELGPLAEVNAGESDVRSVAIGDVTGDGNAEIVLAIGPFQLFDLRVYRKSRSGVGYEEIPVEADVPDAYLGGIERCLLHGRDGHGRQDIYFTLGSDMYDYTNQLFHKFLPRGLHVASWVEEDGVFRVRTLHGTRHVQRTAPHEEDGVPTNIGGIQLLESRRGAESPHLIVHGRTFRGSHPLHTWMQVYRLPEAEASPFVVRLPRTEQPIHAVDLDADGYDEILALDANGEFHCYGRSTPITREPQPLPVERPPVRTPHETTLLVADRFSAVGQHRLAERRFRDVWREETGARWKWQALRGLVSSLDYQGRHDEGVQLLEDYLRVEGGGQAAKRLWLAESLDRALRWREARPVYEDLASLGGLVAAERARIFTRTQDLSAWKQLQVIPLPPPSAWTATIPGHFRIDPATGSVVAEDRGGRQSELYLSGALQNESFQLTFEFTLHALDLGHLVHVGFIQPGGRGLETNGLYLNLASSGDGPRVARPMRWDNRGVRHRPILTGPERAPSLELEVPYRGVLVWNRADHRLGMTVREAETGRRVSTGQTILREDQFDRPTHLTILLYGENYPGRTKLTVRNVVLMRPRAVAREDEPVEAEPLEAAHAAWGRGEFRAALARYRALARDEEIEEDTRFLARFYGAVLAVDLAKTPENLRTLVALLEDGEGKRSSLHLLNGRQTMLGEAAREPLGNALFADALTRWRATGDADVCATIVTAFLWIRPTLDEALDEAVRHVPEPPDAAEREALEAAVNAWLERQREK